MINWDLLTPRNLVVIALFVVIAIAVFNYFSNTHKAEGDN